MSVTISRKGVLSVMFIKLTAHPFEKVYFYTEGGHDKICLCPESALSMRCELVFHCLTMDLIFPLLWGSIVVRENLLLHKLVEYVRST